MKSKLNQIQIQEKDIMLDIFKCLFWWNSPSREWETPDSMQRTYEFIQWYNRRNPNKNKWIEGI